MSMTQGQKGRDEGERGEICSDVWAKIPADVFVQEILSSLPATNLHALKTVCKDWLRLISSPYFVRLHLSRANPNPSRLLLRLPNAFLEYNTYTEETKQLPCQLEIGGLIMGSADGIICSFEHTKWLVDETKTAATFTLHNPSTEERLTTQLWPESPFSKWICCYWFGKRADGEYVSVIGTFSPSPTSYEFAVYKFTASNLKHIHSLFVDTQVEYSFHFKCGGRGMLVHGAVHWGTELLDINDRWRYTIMAYHPDENKYWEISLPAQCDFTLGVDVDGCLLAILKNEEMDMFEVLIMKEYWIRYAYIEDFNYSEALYPMGFFPDGDIILKEDHGQLIKYSFKDKKFKVLIHLGHFRYDAIICLDSLISPPI